jgi:hypothetical protein
MRAECAPEEQVNAGGCLIVVMAAGLRERPFEKPIAPKKRSTVEDGDPASPPPQWTRPGPKPNEHLNQMSPT